MPVVLADSRETLKPRTAAEQQYVDELHRLQTVVDTSLGVGLRDTQRFALTPLSPAATGRSSDRGAPPPLFRNSSQQEEWLRPDLHRISLLARRQHVDGVLLVEMRQPGSAGESLRVYHDPLSLNLLNFSLQRVKPHVLSPRLRAVLVTQSGNIAWQDDEVAFHPRSRPPTMRTLRADWEDATASAAQQLADSLLRAEPADNRDR